MDVLRQTAASAAIGLAVVAALGAVLIATTSPAPGILGASTGGKGGGADGEGSNGGRGGYLVSGGAHLLGLATRSAVAAAAAATAEEVAAAARFGESSYTLNPKSLTPKP
jgi:hypothetical protein